MNVFFIYMAFVSGDTSLYQENNIIENLQAICLAITSFICFIGYFFIKKPEAIISLGNSLLCLSFLLRELDVEKLNVPEFLKLIGSGIGKNLTLSALWLLLLIYMTTHFKDLINSTFFSRLLKPGILLFTSGLLLTLSHLVESHILLFEPYMFFEELLELNGYMILLMAGIITIPNLINNQKLMEKKTFRVGMKKGRKNLEILS